MCVVAVGMHHHMSWYVTCGGQHINHQLLKQIRTCETEIQIKFCLLKFNLFLLHDVKLLYEKCNHSKVHHTLTDVQSLCFAMCVMHHNSQTTI